MSSILALTSVARVTLSPLLITTARSASVSANTACATARESSARPPQLQPAALQHLHLVVLRPAGYGAEHRQRHLDHQLDLLAGVEGEGLLLQPDLLLSVLQPGLGKHF